MRSFLSIALVTSLLVGCTVGPDYVGPPPAAPKALAGGGFVRAGETTLNVEAPTAHWWEQLHDAILNDLVKSALVASPDGRAAEAKLRQARAVLRREQVNGAPSLNGSVLYAHARVPGLDLNASDEQTGTTGGASDLNLYNLGFDASWEVDLFGVRRRVLEATRATVEGAAADSADVQVSLSAEVANAYVNLRERQQQITLGEEALALQQETLELTRQRHAAGTASELDVVQIEGDLSAARAQVTPLTAERDSYLNALAVLTGQEPGALDAALTRQAPVPLPPASVPVGDPAALLRRRPDIRSAERRLAADTARIGQAEAARFPRLSFMGLVGIGGTRLGDLTQLDDFVGIAAPRLSWSFLDFGRNRARVTEAQAVRDEAEARYRSAVLGALRDAEDSLARFRDRRKTVAALARARDAAARTATLTAQRFEGGTATRIMSLDARRRQTVAEQNLLGARAALTQDYVAIQKTLGLGWDSGEIKTVAAAGL